MERDQITELSRRTYQLAEMYQIGQPLAFHNIRPQWRRFYKIIMRIMLGIVACIMFLCLVVISIFLCQYLALLNQHVMRLSNGRSLEEQIADLQGRFSLGFPGIIATLIGCIGCIIGGFVGARRMLVSLLVCTGGLLEIRPNGVGVTRWDEVKGPLQELGSGKQKSYKLHRIKRKPLHFGKAFENTEDLANLVRQQIQKKTSTIC